MASAPQNATNSARARRRSRSDYENRSITFIPAVIPPQLKRGRLAHATRMQRHADKSDWAANGEHSKMAKNNMEFTEFTVKNAPLVRERVQTLLDEFTKETGITFKTTPGSIGYPAVTYKFSVEAGLTVNGVSAVEQVFNQNAKLHDVKEKVGDIISYKGQDYKILGWSQGSRRYPIEVERVSDKSGSRFTLDLLPSKQAAAKERQAIWDAAKLKAATA